MDYIQLREKDLAVRELESLARESVRVVCDASQSPAHLGTKSARTRLLINSRPTLPSLAAQMAFICGPMISRRPRLGMFGNRRGAVADPS